MTFCFLQLSTTPFPTSVSKPTSPPTPFSISPWNPSIQGVTSPNYNLHHMSSSPSQLASPLQKQKGNETMDAEENSTGSSLQNANSTPPLFYKASLNHILGHILSFLPLEQIAPCTLVSKSLYHVIYSPHCLFYCEEMNRYPLPKLSDSHNPISNPFASAPFNLRNVSLVRYYFASMDIFHITDQRPSLERRVFRCLIRRSNHVLKHLSLFRCKLKVKTVYRILDECTALETLIMRFVEWTHSSSDTQFRKFYRDPSAARLHPAPDLSTSAEHEQLLRMLEEPRVALTTRAHNSEKPLNLQLHPNQQLCLKTLEIRNGDASQFDSAALLPVLAQCLETVTNLSLDHFYEDAVRQLLEMMPASNSVQSLHLGHISGALQVEFLDLLASSCLCLQKLSFSHIQYRGFIPSFSNDFSKFYSLQELNTLHCKKSGITEAVLSMLPRHDSDHSQFCSIAYHRLDSESFAYHDDANIPFEHITLRELAVNHFDSVARQFVTQNLSHLTKLHIFDSALTETDMKLLLNLKYLQDLRLKLHNISLSHLFSILSCASGIQFHIQKLVVLLGYPTIEESTEYLVDLESQKMEQLEWLEVHGQFETLPLCFCPHLKHLLIHDMRFDDVPNLLMVTGHYNRELLTMELFSSNIVPREAPPAHTFRKHSPMKVAPAHGGQEKLPLSPCFSARSIRIMISSWHPHIYDMVRMMIHFPEARFDELHCPVIFSKELCLPFVKHRLLPHPPDAFKALVLWCIDQIATRELVLTPETKSYIAHLIRLVDGCDPQSTDCELPLLPHLFSIFSKKFPFAPQLPPFSPPRSLTRVVVYEKHNQFVKHIKRRQKKLLQALNEYCVGE